MNQIERRAARSAMMSCASLRWKEEEEDGWDGMGWECEVRDSRFGV